MQKCYKPFVLFKLMMMESGLLQGRRRRLRWIDRLVSIFINTFRLFLTLKSKYIYWPGKPMWTKPKSRSQHASHREPTYVGRPLVLMTQENKSSCICFVILLQFPVQIVVAAKAVDMYETFASPLSLFPHDHHLIINSRYYFLHFTLQ